MGRRIAFVFEILIIMTLFSLFAAHIVTTSTNDAIIKTTEDFVEDVRYSGEITADAYYEFLESFRVPVDVSFVATRTPVLADSSSGDTLEFTADIMDAIGTEGAYAFHRGDFFQVIVRKASGSYYDAVISSVGGNTSSSSDPAVAIKGGMILKTPGN